MKPPIIILAGGKGTRLGELTKDKPKPMVEICGKPFLWWLIKHYRNQGFENITVSTGHLASVIETYPWPEGWDLKFEEDIGECCPNCYYDADCYPNHWIVNGDTFIPTKLPDDISGPTILCRYHTNVDAGAQFVALGKISIVPVGDFYDMGTYQGLDAFTEYCRTHLLTDPDFQDT